MNTVTFYMNLKYANLKECDTKILTIFCTKFEIMRIPSLPIPMRKLVLNHKSFEICKVFNNASLP
jgi:hypothetical protein